MQKSPFCDSSFLLHNYQIAVVFTMRIFYKTSPLGVILSHMNPLLTLTLYLFKVHCNIPKWQEDEEEDVRSYWMTLRTGEDILI